LRYALDGGFEIEVVVHDRGVFWLQLHYGNGDVPLAEWSVGTYSELHLINPKHEETGALRYYRGGERLPEIDEWLPGSGGDLEAARRFLKKL